MIEAGDLTLRPWQPADVAFVYDACQDPDIQRWTTVPSALPRHRRRRVRAAPTPGRSPRRTAPGSPSPAPRPVELLGSISFNTFDRVAGTGEIGYWLALEARGTGVAATRLAALAALGRRASSALSEAVVRIVARATSASQAVAARAGFVRRRRSSRAAAATATARRRVVYVVAPS